MKPLPQIIERQRVAAGEGMQPRVAEHADHGVGVVGAEQIEHQARGGEAGDAPKVLRPAASPVIAPGDSPG